RIWCETGVRSQPAHAPEALAGELVVVQNLAAEFERVSARRLVLQRKVVAYAPHFLNSVPREVLVLAVRETPQQDPRASRGDVGCQPVVRPRRHGLLIE